MTPPGRLRRDDGFTLIEAIVAVSILAIAIALTIQPVMASLRRVSDARIVSVAENLAQAEIEAARALQYEDVGLPGRTPSGVLTESRVVDVEGREYLIEVDVAYAGSLTGLDVVPQGGDGVEGTWDAGVDYKTVTVAVTAESRERDPVVMETIVAPTQIGAHEGIANARVAVAAHEPFAASEYALPALQVHAAPNLPIRSGIQASSQVFPAIPVGDYTVELDVANGWIIHPGDVVSGATSLAVRAGSLVETAIRVYRPASMEVEVTDADTGGDVSGARVTLTHLDSGVSSVYDVDTDIISGLVPDAYDIQVDAPGYVSWTAASVNIPSGYPDPVHHLVVQLTAIAATTTTTTTTLPGATTTTTAPGATTTTTAPGATTTTTAASGFTTVRFTVENSRNDVVAGATVTIEHPTRGTLTAITDDRGRAFLDLEDDITFTAVASTPWGHGPDSVDFRPSTTSTIDFFLTRPSGLGLMELQDGDRAEFLYRASGSGTWTAMPINYRGEATFVDEAGRYDVAKRCLANGSIEGKRSVRIRIDKNRSSGIRGYCP